MNPYQYFCLIQIDKLQLRFLLLSERYSFHFHLTAIIFFLEIPDRNFPLDDVISGIFQFFIHYPHNFIGFASPNPENLHNVICGNIRYINLHTISSFSFFYLSKVLLQYASISYLLFNTFFICTFNSYLHHTFILHICQYIFLILRTCNSFYFMLYYP